MKTTSKNQLGFGSVELVLVLVIVVLVGVVGWLVYKTHNKTVAPTTTATTKSVATKTPKASTKPADPYAGWLTYTSKVGGFSLRYPAEWIIEGHTGTYGETTVPASQLNGTESSVDIASTTAKTNVFDEWINITSSPNSLSSLDATETQIPYAQGSIINNLPNGIGVWQAGRTLTINGHISNDAYPTIESASNGQFGFRLTNGKYLDAALSFTVGPHGSGIDTTYSYDQQVNSPELQQGINILASIKQ